MIVMIKVLFVCHGNICRSPMAEYLFKDYVKKKGMADRFWISSCATSGEEIGNPVHFGTRRILNFLGIDCSDKRAVRFTKQDYVVYDYILAMDRSNIRDIFSYGLMDKQNKIFLLLEFAGVYRDIDDPWYSQDFSKAYQDICLGLDGFYNFLLEKKEC